MKKKQSITLIGGTILLLGLISIAYAYFTASITDNTQNDVVITTNSMRLTFADGETNSISATLDLGESITKKFTIENTGNMDTYARIMWKDLKNTFIYRDLKYTLSWSTTENGTYTNLTYNENVPTSKVRYNNTDYNSLTECVNAGGALNSTCVAQASNVTLKGGIKIPTNTKYYFKLTITLMDWENWDQTADMDAKFTSKFALESAYEDESTKTLLAMGLDAQNKISNSGNYDELATTDETADGLFSMEDDYGTSYYFRGKTENNYVKFGKYSDTAYYGYKTAGDANDFMVYKDADSCAAGIQVAGETAYNVNCTAATALAGKPMYWRIIRINGDGSVRMIYDGTEAWTSEMMRSATSEEKKNRVALRRIPWNLTHYNDAKYIGYMYGGANGEASTYYQSDINVNDYANSNNSVYNETPSNMKTILENWFEQNLLDYDNYLGDEIFCNDRTISTDGRKWWSDDTMKGFGSTVARYGGFLRHYTEAANTYNNRSHSPYLKCDQKNDSFTVSDITRGNGKLGKKVGLITIDEANIAGGRYHRSDNSSNNNQFYLYKGTWYWSFSPRAVSNGYVHMLNVYATGDLGNYSVHGTGGVAPVINLSAAYARLLIGNGTVGNEYRLE